MKIRLGAFSKIWETKSAESRKLSEMTMIEWEKAADQERTECRNISEIATIADAPSLPDGIAFERDRTSEADLIFDGEK
jgi:hypothetical protein